MALGRPLRSLWLFECYRRARRRLWSPQRPQLGHGHQAPAPFVEARTGLPVSLEEQLRKLLGGWRRREGRLPTLAEVSAAMGWAAEWVWAWRAEHCEGPLWSELVTAMGWPRRVGVATVRALRDAGWAIFTNEARSLDVAGGLGQLHTAPAGGTTAGQGPGPDGQAGHWTSLSPNQFP